MMSFRASRKKLGCRSLLRDCRGEANNLLGIGTLGFGLTAGTVTGIGFAKDEQLQHTISVPGQLLPGLQHWLRNELEDAGRTIGVTDGEKEDARTWSYQPPKLDGYGEKSTSWRTKEGLLGGTYQVFHGDRFDASSDRYGLGRDRVAYKRNEHSAAWYPGGAPVGLGSANGVGPGIAVTLPVPGGGHNQAVINPDGEFSLRYQSPQIPVGEGQAFIDGRATTEGFDVSAVLSGGGNWDAVGTVTNKGGELSLQYHF